MRRCGKAGREAGVHVALCAKREVVGAGVDGKESGTIHDTACSGTISMLRAGVAGRVFRDHVGRKRERRARLWRRSGLGADPASWARAAACRAVEARNRAKRLFGTCGARGSSGVAELSWDAVEAR